ncbi:alpha/beta hydrolase-fold protein [Nocardia sp. NPDC005825]|uniref:alpha/beta hydrolase n=1 Tax=Nocardia sp. NPDC005825 TaxID=3155452 RepID=UPI0034038BE2
MADTIAVVFSPHAPTQSPPLGPPPAPHPPAARNGYGGFHHGVSLLHGWVPQVVAFVAVLLLVIAFARATRRWWVLWMPVCAVGGVAAAWAAWDFVDDQGLASDPAPVLLWASVGLTAAGLVAAVVGLRTGGWWQRIAAVLAVPAALLYTGVVLNQWVGYYPTVQAAWDALNADPLPHQVDLDELAELRNTDVGTGRIVEVDIPEAGSDFRHRREYVYLPPAWFAGDKPPALPAVMMIGGEFNTPADWVRSGQIMPAVDAFAAKNNGQTPVLVFVDSGGSFNNDTECVNGPRGNAADHLTKDVPGYVESEFGVAKDPAQWAVVGWSMGGTCAVDLAVMHPDLFGTFVDIAGDLGPTAGSKEQTIKRLYGGNADAWAQFDPLTVMEKHGPYTGVVGLFDDLTAPKRTNNPGANGAPNGQPRNLPGMPKVSEEQIGKGGRDGVQDANEEGAAEQLCDAGRKVGIDCTVHTTVGGHTWQFAASAFTSSFPWLTARLGIPVPGLSS